MHPPEGGFPNLRRFRRWSNRAIALRSAERYQEATTHYQLVVKKAPTDAGAHYDLANCLEKLGKLDEAAKAYEQYAKLVRLKDPKGAERADQRAESLKHP